MLRIIDYAASNVGDASLKVKILFLHLKLLVTN